jgi:hypothetical protein
MRMQVESHRYAETVLEGRFRGELLAASLIGDVAAALAGDHPAWLGGDV